MPRQSEGCRTGYLRGRSHHERARCRRGAERGFGHHRGRQWCRALFGPVFSCNLPVPIRSGLKPDYGWEGYAPRVASNFPAYRRWRSFETSCDPTDRPAGRNPTGNLFALLKLQCRHSSATRRRSDPSIESHDPLDAASSSFPAPGRWLTHFVRSSSAPKVHLLLRREQYP